MAEHVVEQGECLATIAAHHGFEWPTLWNHPNNADLKKRRKDPNILFPGDVVFVPDKDLRKETVATGKRHRFVRKGGAETLRLRLLDELDGPRAQFAYELIVGDDRRTGTTNDDGELFEELPPHTKEVKLLIAGAEEQQEMTVLIGSLDPPDTVTGAQARLTNLGFDSGPADGDIGPRTIQALLDFQEANGLDPTGKLDDKTQAALRDQHGR